MLPMGAEEDADVVTDDVGEVKDANENKTNKSLPRGRNVAAVCLSSGDICKYIPYRLSFSLFEDNCAGTRGSCWCRRAIDVFTALISDGDFLAWQHHALMTTVP